MIRVKGEGKKVKEYTIPNFEIRIPEFGMIAF